MEDVYITRVEKAAELGMSRRSQRNSKSMLRWCYDDCFVFFLMRCHVAETVEQHGSGTRREHVFGTLPHCSNNSMLANFLLSGNMFRVKISFLIFFQLELLVAWLTNGAAFFTFVGVLEAPKGEKKISDIHLADGGHCKLQVWSPSAELRPRVAVYPAVHRPPAQGGPQEPLHAWSRWYGAVGIVISLMAVWY